MNCKLFRKTFPELLSSRGRSLSWLTYRDKIHKHKQTLAHKLIGLGFKPDTQYTSYTSGEQSGPFTMIELTGYDKQMRPLYNVHESLFMDWMRNWA